MAFEYESIEQQLRLAAKAGDTELVMALLEQGAQIDVAPSSRTTAFRLAWKHQHLDLARLLLRSGASAYLEDATTLEELRFLQECGVKDRPIEEIDARIVRNYEKGLLSLNEMEIALGRRHDPALTEQTTISNVEVEESFGRLRCEWEMLKSRMQRGDELWKFDNGKWDQLAGRQGYALLRHGRRIMTIRTLMN